MSLVGEHQKELEKIEKSKEVLASKAEVLKEQSQSCRS
jgi:hypothetical protein